MSQPTATAAVGEMSRRDTLRVIAAVAGGGAGVRDAKPEEDEGFVGGMAGGGTTRLALGNWPLYIVASETDIDINTTPALVFATEKDEWQAYGFTVNMSTQAQDGTLDAITASTIEDAQIDRPNTLVIALDTDEFAYFEEVPT